MPLRHMPTVVGVACLMTLAVPGAVRAQDNYFRTLSPAAIADLIASARPDTPVPLAIANRTVTVFRAGILGRGTAERAEAAGALLHSIAADGQRHTVSREALGAAAVISVDGRGVFAIVPADGSELLGESVESKAAAAVERLQLALDELAEARRPQVLVWG